MCEWVYNEDSCCFWGSFFFSWYPNVSLWWNWANTQFQEPLLTFLKSWKRFSLNDSDFLMCSSRIFGWFISWPHSNTKGVVCNFSPHVGPKLQYNNIVIWHIYYLSFNNFTINSSVQSSLQTGMNPRSMPSTACIVGLCLHLKLGMWFPTGIDTLVLAPMN